MRISDIKQKSGLLSPQQYSSIQHEQSHNQSVAIHEISPKIVPATNNQTTEIQTQTYPMVQHTLPQQKYSETIIETVYEHDDSNTMLKITIISSLFLTIIFIIISIISFSDIKDDEGKLKTKNLIIGISSLIGIFFTLMLLVFSIYKL